MAIVIDTATTYQTIDGFGVDLAVIPSVVTDAVADLLWSQSAGIGLTWCRLRASVVDGSLTGGSAGAGSVGTAQKARDRGGRFWALADGQNTTPAGWLTYPLIDGYPGPATLDPAFYQSYADSVAKIVAAGAAAGLTVEHVSINNEPEGGYSYDYFRDPVTADVSGAVIRDVVKLVSPTAGAGVMLPETISTPHLATYADPVLNDATARARLSRVGTHVYDTSALSPYSTAVSYGIPVWQTEYNDVYMGAATDLQSALNVATRTHQCLADANMAMMGFFLVAGLPGWTGSRYGLLGDGFALTKRYYAFGHFSKFVRPGFQRIACSGAPAGVYASAYKKANGSIAIVVINTNATGGADGTGATAINVNGLGSIPAITPWITDATHDLAQMADLPVTGGAVSYTIAGQSLLTLSYAPIDPPVITSPATGAGYPAQSGSFSVQVTGCQPGATEEVWINGSPYTTTRADVNGNAVAVVSWPLGADFAQAGDTEQDAVRSVDATQDGGVPGMAAGAFATGAETPIQGSAGVDAPGTGTNYGEVPKQGGAASDVATGFQQSVEVLRQQAAQGEASGDVFTPGGALSAPSIASPTSGTDLTGLPGVMVQAIGANAGAVLEFFVNGQPAGSVGADVAGTAQWYLPVPWGADSAQAGDRVTDVYTPAPTGTILEALKDGPSAGDLAGDRISARESTSDGGTLGDRAPQSFVDGVTDSTGAAFKGTSAVISPLGFPLPNPLHARPLPAFLEADGVRACLFARTLSPYLRCGMADIVYQGADRDIQFQIPRTDADGNVIDYTNAQLRCGAQSGTSPRIPSDGTAINALALTARARFTAATTLSMTAGGLYYYDGFVNLGDGRIVPVGSGSFTVRTPFTAAP